MNRRWNLLSSTFLCFAVLSLCAVNVSIVHAEAPKAEEDADTDAAGRTVLRDLVQRPEEERGWFIAAKATYWPLCYEALDRLEECRALNIKDDHKALALSLEKSAAWLKLAASAAMTDGAAGIESCSERLESLAESIREGKEFSHEAINHCITLGEICIAKSHVMRADAPNNEPVPGPSKATKAAAKPATAIVREAEREILAEQMAAAWAQFRYDAIQSVRHLSVAQIYLATAAKSGAFSVPDSISASLIDFTKIPEEEDITSTFEEDVMPRVDEMMVFVEQQRKDVRSKIVELMEEGE